MSEQAKGRTIVRHAEGRDFTRGLRAFFEYGDLGIAEATKGGFGAHVIRAIPGVHAEPQWHLHELEFQMVWIVKGWVRFEYEDIGEVTLTAGTSVLQPPRIRHREIAHSDDLELVEITAPASFETKLVEAP
ncbi:cupin domain-containing protein [Sediminicoccus sp. BL-A-41-H5]|uniref:cupin domain-containing protein n=1 Tax=Sediminicoccus sp. BL-A-41-H5 TaxID=3421106 RepID=UPI003D66728D